MPVPAFVDSLSVSTGRGAAGLLVPAASDGFRAAVACCGGL